MALRHMEVFGTTSRQLGEITVTMRRHALLNDNAVMRQPMTIEDHQSSRMHRVLISFGAPLSAGDSYALSSSSLSVTVRRASPPSPRMVRVTVRSHQSRSMVPKFGSA
jgi:hypothetical protein